MKKKEKIETPAEDRIYIDYQETRSGGEPLSDEEWSNRADSNIEIEFLGAYRSPPKHKFFYDSFPVDPELHKPGKVYLAVVRYSTGDTFGRTNGAWHLVGLAKNSREAQEMLDAALNGTGWKPWEGYFERFESTEIHSLEVWD